jgi:hypothetical protein
MVHLPRPAAPEPVREDDCDAVPRGWVNRRRVLLSGGVLAAGALGSATMAPAVRAATAAATGPTVLAPPPSGGDDYAALAAAMPSYGVLELQVGVYHLSKNLAVPDGCDLRGQGGGIAFPVTILQCTAADAGVTVSAAGGLTGGFAVDGNQIATAPFLRNGGQGPWVGRLFADLTVLSSAQDGITCLAGQNDAWYQVSSIGHARDTLVCDQGYGGTLFSRCELASGSRYNVRIDSQISGGPYARPSDIVFHQCIFEYTNAASVGVAFINGATTIKFDHTSFYSSLATSGPLLDVTNGSAEIVIEDAVFQSTPTTVGGIGVRVRGGSQVIFTGVTHFQNFAEAIHLGAAKQVDVKGLLLFYQCTSRYGADAGINIQSLIGNTQTEVLVSNRTAAGDLAYVSRNSAGGFYTFETADGTRRWGSGIDYVGDVTLYRHAAGVLGVETTQLLATGVGPTASRPPAAVANAGAIRVNSDTGQLESSDGTRWLAPTKRLLSIGSSRTVTVPAGVTAMRARVIGGGGGGGGGGTIGLLSTATSCYGGAGGGAGMLIDVEVAVTPGDQLQVVVGAGGAGGAGGAASGLSTGSAGAAGKVGGASRILASTGTVLAEAPGGGGGPAGRGTNLTSPVAPVGGGAYGCPDTTAETNAPGCGASASHSAVPAAGGICGGASGAPSNRSHGGSPGSGAAAPGQRSTVGTATNASVNGATGAKPGTPGCGGNGGGAGGANGAGGAGGAGSTGGIELWWVA